jgi:hypothetical protein
MSLDNVTSIDKPRCSRCGAFKPASELNGINPFATGSEKYKNAQCYKLAECDSEEARELFGKLISHVDATD